MPKKKSIGRGISAVLPMLKKRHSKLKMRMKKRNSGKGRSTSAKYRRKFRMLR